jgi:hypothetical protein
MLILHSSGMRIFVTKKEGKESVGRRKEKPETEEEKEEGPTHAH